MISEVLALVPASFRDDLEKAVMILQDGGAKEVFLFGSLAQGRAQEASDLDLAVSGVPAKDFFALYSKTARQLEHDLDLVDLDHEILLADFLKSHHRLVQIG